MERAGFQISMIKLLQSRFRVALAVIAITGNDGVYKTVKNKGKRSWRAEAAIHLCLCLLVFGAGLLVGCASPPQMAADHVEQAEHWAARGKPNEAILEYRRAIQLDPKAP